MDTSEDEFTFDFSKSKNKKEELNEKKSKSESGKENKQEHKSHHHEEKEHSYRNKAAEKDEELTFDFKSVTKAADKYKKFIIPLFLILICIYVGAYYRMAPNNLPVTDDWAKSTVFNYYKTNIRAQIDQSYPNLPEANKNTLVETQFSDFYNQNKATVEGQIKQVSQSFKDQFKDENGYTYLGDIDSYFWMRYAKNIIEKGQYGDEIRNGKEWDTYMLAPVGARAVPTLYPYIEAINYKIMHFFNPKLTLMQSIFYVPIILSLIAIIAAFFIATKIAGYFGGFIAAFLVAIHPMILSRTFGSDNDIINVFFPLVILWLFLEAFETKNRLKGILISAVNGFIIGLFSFAWGGWWFILFFILASCAVYIMYYFIIDFKEIKKGLIKYLKNSDISNVLIVLGTIIVFSAIFVSVFSGVNSITNVISYPFSFLTIKAATRGTASLWPNVYTTVAELNAASWDTIVGSVGGNLLFIISIIGIILTVVKKDEKGKRDVKFAVFLIIWYLATIYASLKGVRFIMLLAPTVCISVGVAVGILYQYANNWLSKALDLNKIITRTILIALCLLILIQPLKAVSSSAKSEVPIMNDGWYNTLNLIKQNSTQDAIINSWWDFGHHFKYVADRRVTADGASQNRPQAHWIGKVLLTGDEKEAVGILKMLDCSSDRRAFDAIDAYVNDTSKSTQMIYKIVVLDSNNAKKVLKEYMPQEEANNIVNNYTHCTPPEDYFITSEDMVGKSGVWAHFGSWNFNRAEMWVNVRGLPLNEAVNFLLSNKDYNLTKDEAEKIYFEIQSLKDDAEANSWIAPWPGYASGLVGCSQGKTENMLICSNGIEVNLTSKEMLIPTNDGVKLAKRVGYMDSGLFKVKEFKGNFIEYAGDIIKNGDSYSIVLMSPELADSMFTRLFFYDGDGMKYFNKFSDVRDVTGARIIVWKVNWEGK